ARQPSPLPQALLQQPPPNLPIRDVPAFVEEVRKLFDNMVCSWSQVLFPQKYRQAIKDAWDQAKGWINAFLPAWQKVPQQKKSDAGLHGKQLDLKLAGLSGAWDRFVKKGTVRLLKKLLSWINTILGSIASVVPGGEALKELKDALEKLIEED